MDSGPAAFAGTALALFGAGLLLWTSIRLWSREPVAQDVPQAAGAALTILFGVISVMSGGWLLLSG